VGEAAGKRKHKRDWAVLDLDGHTKTLYGVQKKGRTWKYALSLPMKPRRKGLLRPLRCEAVRAAPL